MIDSHCKHRSVRLYVCVCVCDCVRCGVEKVSDAISSFCQVGADPRTKWPPLAESLGVWSAQFRGRPVEGS